MIFTRGDKLLLKLLNDRDKKYYPSRFHHLFGTVVNLIDVRDGDKPLLIAEDNSKVAFRIPISLVAKKWDKAPDPDQRLLRWLSSK